MVCKVDQALAQCHVKLKERVMRCVCIRQRLEHSVELVAEVGVICILTYSQWQGCFLSTVLTDERLKVDGMWLQASPLTSHVWPVSIVVLLECIIWNYIPVSICNNYLYGIP